MSGGKASIQCLLCPKSFVVKDLLEHIHEHVEYNPQQCNDCDFECIMRNELDHHTFEHDHTGRTQIDPYKQWVVHSVNENILFAAKNGKEELLKRESIGSLPLVSTPKLPSTSRTQPQQNQKKHRPPAPIRAPSYHELTSSSSDEKEEPRPSQRPATLPAHSTLKRPRAKSLSSSEEEDDSDDDKPSTSKKQLEKKYKEKMVDGRLYETLELEKVSSDDDAEEVKEESEASMEVDNKKAESDSSSCPSVCIVSSSGGNSSQSQQKQKHRPLPLVASPSHEITLSSSDEEEDRRPLLRHASKLEVSRRNDNIVIKKGVTGTVRHFNRSFGFIIRDDTKEDLFVHHTTIINTNHEKYLSSLRDGEKVLFDVVKGPPGKCNEASNVTRLDRDSIQGKYTLYLDQNSAHVVDLDGESSCEGRSQIESISRFKKRNETEVECILCNEFRSSDVKTLIGHLKRKHSTTLGLAGFFLRCDCGNESQSEKHSLTCEIDKYTLIRKKDGPIQTIDKKVTPQCTMCEVYPKNAIGYARHLERYHNTTLQAIRMYTMCSCGFKVTCLTSDPSHNHKKMCDSRKFTLHKLDEN